VWCGVGRIDLGAAVDGVGVFDMRVWDTACGILAFCTPAAVDFGVRPYLELLYSVLRSQASI
jgi:hypothetical protein